MSFSHMLVFLGMQKIRLLHNWPENCKFQEPSRPKLNFMKNTPLLLSILFLCPVLFACKKGDGNDSFSPSSSFYFSPHHNIICFPVNLVYIQDVYDVRTTLISGQYKDTSTRKGNVSFRLIGDTTGRYHGD